MITRPVCIELDCPNVAEINRRLNGKIYYHKRCVRHKRLRMKIDVSPSVDTYHHLTNEEITT